MAVVIPEDHCKTERRGGSDIRKALVEGTVVFSVVDVSRVLTEGEGPTLHWQTLKEQWVAEGNGTDLILGVIQLEVKNLDGHSQVVEAADAETMSWIVDLFPQKRSDLRDLKSWFSTVANQPFFENVVDPTIIEPHQSAGRNVVWEAYPYALIASGIVAILTGLAILAGVRFDFLPAVLFGAIGFVVSAGVWMAITGTILVTGLLNLIRGERRSRFESQ